MRFSRFSFLQQSQREQVKNSYRTEKCCAKWWEIASNLGVGPRAKSPSDWEFRLQQKRLRPPAHLHELSLCNFSTRQSQLHESFFVAFLIDMRGAPLNKGNFLAPCELRVNFFLVFSSREKHEIDVGLSRRLRDQWLEFSPCFMKTQKRLSLDEMQAEEANKWRCRWLTYLNS